MNQTHTTGINVLYAEDDLQTQMSLVSILQIFFDEITPVSNGEEALEAFINHSFDLIITDIHMPKLSGIDLIREIRTHNKSIPIVVTSAHNNVQYLADSIKNSVDAYLFKPLLRDELNEVMKEIKTKILTHKKEREGIQLLQHYKDIADQSYIISKTDAKGYITYVNDEFCKITGYSREEILQQNRYNILHFIYESPQNIKELWRTIKHKKQIWQGVIKSQTKSGETYYVKSTIKPLFDEEGNIQEFIASKTLISDIIHPQEQLFDFLASHNNSLVVLMQIENFEELEKSLPLPLRKKIQEQFAQNLLSSQHATCKFSKIYILGSGKFAFAKEYGAKELNPLTHALKTFQNNINNAQIRIKPLDYDLAILISYSYGEDVLENAQIGLEKLRSSNQRFIVANELLQQHQQKAIQTIATYNMIQKAIDSYNIVSYFQPIVNNKTQKIEKYESLVRLIDEKKRLYTPHHFLGLAKKQRKFYEKITSMILENSFKALYKTKNNISINFSILDIENNTLRTMFIQLLQQHKREAHRIVLELLEDHETDDIKMVQEFIHKVKSHGVKIAIDDFGTGYSNFKRILEYQPDILKIDGSLIRNIEYNTASFQMIETLVSFAKKQKILTIAEYVENENIYTILCELGVDYSQGYYFGEPEILI